MPRRKCLGNCGRWLTSPEAVALGYGRVCAERLGIPTGRPARQPTRLPTRSIEVAPEVHPDQTALELRPHQPSLWSI